MYTANRTLWVGNVDTPMTNTKPHTGISHAMSTPYPENQTARLVRNTAVAEVTGLPHVSEPVTLSIFVGGLSRSHGEMASGCRRTVP